MLSVLTLDTCPMVVVTVVIIVTIQYVHVLVTELMYMTLNTQ